jgi:hypothetical protein
MSKKSKTQKRINYYYSSKDNDNKLIYKCLYDDETEIIIENHLELKNTKNYRMNNYYEATDTDLFKFKKDLKNHNDEIKKLFFTNDNGVKFKIDVFHYNTIQEIGRAHV